jgi:hypothetical protein
MDGKLPASFTLDNDFAVEQRVRLRLVPSKRWAGGA